MTTAKIFEHRLVRVPYSEFFGARTHYDWEQKVFAKRRELSEKFGPNWDDIGPTYEDNSIESCVELHYQRIYEVVI